MLPCKAVFRAVTSAGQRGRPELSAVLQAGQGACLEGLRTRTGSRPRKADGPTRPGPAEEAGEPRSVGSRPQSLLSSEGAVTGDEGVGSGFLPTWSPAIPYDCQAPLWSTVNFQNSAPTNLRSSGSPALFRTVLLKGGPPTAPAASPESLEMQTLRPTLSLWNPSRLF